MPLSSLARRTRGAAHSLLQLPAGGVATPGTLLAGVRAGTATVLPIVAAYATGESLLVWMALGGWLSTFADAGGAYRARARALTAFGVLGGVSCFVAALASHSPWAAVPLVFAWAWGGAMLRLFGDAATSVGNLAAITFVASLATPADLHGASVRAGLFVLGCGLAMLLSLVVWPLRPWGPARRAVAACYDALARFARAIGAALVEAPSGGRPWHELALRDHGPIRLAIETARVAVGQTRRSRVGSSQRGEDVVVLLETAELLFEALIAAAVAVESSARVASGSRQRAEDASSAPATTPAADARVLDALQQAVVAVADALARLAERIPVASRWREADVARTHATDRAVLALWEAVDAAGHAAGAPARHAHASQAAALLEHAATLVDVGTDAVGSLVEARPAVAGTAPQRRAPGRGVAILLARTVTTGWSTLRANLSTDSLVLRHATRAGIVAAVATGAAAALHLSHASWVTTTALIVLQPYAGLTRRRGVERVTWTVLGGIVAAVLAAVLHDRLLIAAVMFPLSVASIAVRAAHYGLFTFFLTPVFVLLAEPATGDWKLAAVRMLYTVAGGALALLASRVLWPTWEHRRLPSDLATMVDAVRTYFRAVESQSLGSAASAAPTGPAAVGAARRRVGLAANNADAAFQRFVVEPRGPLTDVESLMAVLTFARRLTGAITVLAVGAPARGADRGGLAAAIDATLAEVAAAIREERPPGPLPEQVARFSRSRGDAPPSRDARALRTTLELPVGGVGLDRVARQTGVLHAAASRAFDGRLTA